MIFVLVFVSYFLDGIFASFLPSYGLFRPLFTLLSILLIYPYCYYQKKTYFFLAFIAGFFYDLTYTNTPFFHGVLFVLLAALIQLWNQYYRNTLPNLILASSLLILIYRVIGYLLLLFLQTFPFNFMAFFKVIGSSFFLNWIYILLVFPFFSWIAQKKHLHSMN